MGRTRAARKSQSASHGGKRSRGGVAFYLIFIVAGTLFTLSMGIRLFEDVRPRFWTRVSANVLESSLEENTTSLSSNESGDRFAVRVSYRYHWDGSQFSNKTFRRVETLFSAEAAQRHLSRFPPGAVVDCHVNPAAPSEAVLDFKPFTQWLALIFPLTPVAIGLAGIYSARRKTRVHCVGQIIYAALVLLGGTILWECWVIPKYKAYSAQKWMPVQGEISLSTVTTMHGSETTTFRLDLTYRYTFLGRDYVGDRYYFGNDSSSDRAWREEASRRLAVGTAIHCLVNPNDPVESVILPEAGGGNWIVIFPAVMIGVGIAGLFGKLRTHPQKEHSP